MKENRIAVRIRCPVSKVFDFAVNPANTPKWIAGIVEEKTNEFPPRVGTVYRNKNKDGEWTEYEVVEFAKDREFVLRQKGADYRVRYSFKQLGGGFTELTYFEWVEHGELKDPFTNATLEKLKSLLEKG